MKNQGPDSVVIDSWSSLKDAIDTVGKPRPFDIGDPGEHLLLRQFAEQLVELFYSASSHQCRRHRHM
ncbi:hypothetical protein X769_22100 [Mesorhizobium sp. LSJC268A00]|nr:hypothetical protein X769_22100 [Mesorhizobium sp. LSJC268A00]